MEDAIFPPRSCLFTAHPPLDANAQQGKVAAPVTVVDPVPGSPLLGKHH